jgi:hypothetical protein
LGEVASDAARLFALFEGSDAGHGYHGEPQQEPGSPKWKIVGTARTAHSPATVELWERHLRGEYSLGVIPIRRDGLCLWGSIDVDEYDMNPLELIAKCEALDYPLVPCRSKSGGLHLFMFLREWVPAAALSPALRHLAATLGLSSKVEIFPKQTQVLAGSGDVGNWIVMPYNPNTYGGKLRPQVGLKKTGAEMLLSEFLQFAEDSKVSGERLGALRATRVRGSASPGTAVGAAGGPFADGPPCLQHLVAGNLLGDGRKRALFHMGIYYKKAAGGEWRGALEEANQKFMVPPLPSDQVTGVIKSLAKKEYNYLCKEEPMRSYCDSMACRARRHGVGDGSAMPQISGISKLDTDPPRWFVDVEDRRIEATTEQLQQYQQFHKLCMEQLNRCYQPMKQGDWFQALQAAMANVVMVEAPPEVGAAGHFGEMLEDFLTNRAAGERKEDMLSGRPWHDEEGSHVPGGGPRHYFRLRDLQAYLAREGAPREMTRGWVTQRIRALGGEYKFFNLKGKPCGTFWVPAAAVSPTPELDLPKARSTPI